MKLEGQKITVKGPKGLLSRELPFGVEVQVGPEMVNVLPPSRPKEKTAFQGLVRSLINNMVVGVTEGFTKKLEIHGVGYNAKVQRRSLTLAIGFCHPVDFEIPEGLTVECPTNVSIVITGCDKQVVGQLAAKVRAIRPPEPYNAKGIRYEGEYIQRKAGKSFVSSD